MPSTAAAAVPWPRPAAEGRGGLGGLSLDGSQVAIMDQWWWDWQCDRLCLVGVPHQKMPPRAANLIGTGLWSGLSGAPRTVHVAAAAAGSSTSAASVGRIRPEIPRSPPPPPACARNGFAERSTLTNQRPRASPQRKARASIMPLQSPNGAQLCTPLRPRPSSAANARHSPWAAGISAPGSRPRGSRPGSAPTLRLASSEATACELAQPEERAVEAEAQPSSPQPPLRPPTPTFSTKVPPSPPTPTSAEASLSPPSPAPAPQLPPSSVGAAATDSSSPRAWAGPWTSEGCMLGDAPPLAIPSPGSRLPPHKADEGAAEETVLPGGGGSVAELSLSGGAVLVREGRRPNGSHASNASTYCNAHVISSSTHCPLHMYMDASRGRAS